MSSEKLAINVATQNILLDNTRTRHGQVLPQDYRVESMAMTLANVEGELDVVGIQEAHRSPRQHNGIALASALGYGPGIWFEHNPPNPATKKGRKGEHLGLFGNMVQHAEQIELGDRRIAILTRIAGVAFVTTHLRAGKDAAEKRYLQAVELLNALEDHPDAVLFGDFNESSGTPRSSARKLLEGSGEFVSAFQMKPKAEKPPATYPTKQYRDVMWANKSMLKRIIGRNGVRLDDIYVRGNIEVLDADIIEPVFQESLGLLNLENPEHYATAPLAPSDHFGLRATVEVPAENF